LYKGYLSSPRGSTQVQQAAKWSEALKITATTNNSRGKSTNVHSSVNN